LSVQRASVWSKSWTQSVTGGCSGMMLSDIRAGSSELSAREYRGRSFLGDFDCDLGAVGLGEVGLVLEAGRHGAVADLVGIAVFVEVEQFGCQRFAAGMTLALVLIDANFERHGRRFPLVPARPPRTFGVFRLSRLAGSFLTKRRPTAVSLNYSLLHYRRLVLSSEKL